MTISYVFIYNSPILELGQLVYRKGMEQNVRKPEVELILSLCFFYNPKHVHF